MALQPCGEAQPAPATHASSMKGTSDTKRASLSIAASLSVTSPVAEGTAAARPGVSSETGAT